MLCHEYLTRLRQTVKRQWWYIKPVAPKLVTAQHLHCDSVAAVFSVHTVQRHMSILASMPRSIIHCTCASIAIEHSVPMSHVLASQKVLHAVRKLHRQKPTVSLLNLPSWRDYTAHSRPVLTCSNMLNWLRVGITRSSTWHLGEA